MDEAPGLIRSEAHERGIPVVLFTAADSSTVMKGRASDVPVGASYSGAAIDVTAGTFLFYEESESRRWRKGRSTHLLVQEASAGSVWQAEFASFGISQDGLSGRSGEE
jgi:hypothetical protein